MIILVSLSEKICLLLLIVLENVMICFCRIPNMKITSTTSTVFLKTGSYQLAVSWTYDAETIFLEVGILLLSYFDPTHELFQRISSH